MDAGEGKGKTKPSEEENKRGGELFKEGERGKVSGGVRGSDWLRERGKVSGGGRGSDWCM